MSKVRLNWEKWGLTFWGLFSQHLSVAGMTWLGIGLNNGKIDWKSLWVAFVMGAFLPSLFKFLGSNPTPEIEKDEETNNPAVKS